MKKTFSLNNPMPRPWLTILPTLHGFSLPGVSRFIWLLLFVLPSIGSSSGAEDGNLGHGRFEDITTKAGVGLADQIAVTASFADVDNDGDPDLFVTTVAAG